MANRTNDDHDDTDSTNERHFVLWRRRPMTTEPKHGRQHYGRDQPVGDARDVASAIGRFTGSG